MNDKKIYDDIGTTSLGKDIVLSERPKFIFSLRDDLTKLCEDYNSTLPILADGPVPLKPDDFLPHQADEESTGYDVRCAIPSGIVMQPGHYLKIPLGIRMFAPKGWWLKLAPRSSTFIKLNIHPLYGVIDETFENELVFVGQYLPDQGGMYSFENEKKISFGDRIGQVIPVKRQLMEVVKADADEYRNLTQERKGKRGTGGFGSSGVK